MKDKLSQPTPRRVLLLGAEPASLINFRAPIIRRLVDLGHDVHVAAAQASPHQLELICGLRATFHAVPFARAGMNPLSDLKTAFALFRLFRAIRPQAVISYTSKPVVYGSLAAVLARVPRRVAMITGLGYSFVDGAEWPRRIARLVSRGLYKLALPFCTTVMFQNPDDRDEFQRLGLLNWNKDVSLVHGSGVDTSHFAPTPSPEKPVFLMIARILADKGVREYAAAAAMVRQQNREAVFQLLGGMDPSPNAIRAEELQSWQQHGIAYLGETGDVRPLIAAASVVVLPSYREGTPRSVLEGMAMARAIVTTDVPGCRETVVHGSNGLLVPARNVDMLAQAMLELSLDRDRTLCMGRQSRIIAVAKFDATAVAIDTVAKAGLDATSVAGGGA